MWEMTDQIYRYNPIDLSAADIQMFHGFDERIAVDTYAKLALFWRNFILNSEKLGMKRNK